MLASVLQTARSPFGCSPRTPRLLLDSTTSRRLVGFYSAYDTTTASAAARGALSSGGVPNSTRAPVLPRHWGSRTASACAYRC